MDKLAKLHHSLIDWNLAPASTLALAYDYFVSPPTCLKSGGAGKPARWNWYFLKEALSGAMRHGRVLWYHYPKGEMTFTTELHFRAQDFPLIFRPLNGYNIVVLQTYMQLYKIVAGVRTILAQSAPYSSTPLNAWTRYRVTWWSWLDAGFNPVMTVVVERYEAGVPVQRFQHDILNPLWEDSPVNRVGWTVYGRDTEVVEYVDNTEIWKPIE